MYAEIHDGLPDPDLDGQFYDGVPLRRLLAWLVDAFLIAVLTFVLSLFSLGIFFFFYFAVWLVVGFAYRAITIAGNSATLGMRLVGIELRNRMGNRLDGSEAFVHTFAYHMVFLVPFGVAISAVLMLVNHHGRGLHDVFLGTTAINRPADL
ncbi:MAG: RDD family protein [Rhodobacteraceae bacterium]|nr:RDD family protein [Paracoccaceae bacterium]